MVVALRFPYPAYHHHLYQPVGCRPYSIRGRSTGTFFIMRCVSTVIVCLITFSLASFFAGLVLISAYF